jgi:spore germination protein GerM
MRGRLPRLVAFLAVAAVLLVTTACGIPTSGSPSVIPGDRVPFDLLDPVSPTTTSPATPPAVAVPETIYLVAPNQHLIAVSRYIAIPATLTQILTALLDGPTAAESTSGLESFLTGAAIGVKATTSGGIATVDFIGNPVQVVGPDQTLAIAQVVFTATQQPNVTGVLFQIDDAPVDVPIGSGAQVSSPVSRSSYAPQAPLP